MYDVQQDYKPNSGLNSTRFNKPQHDLDDLRPRLNCRNIARHYLGEPKISTRKYDQYIAPRGERTESFTVYDDGFKDFGGNGDSGDAFALIMLLDSNAHSFSDAVKIAADFVGGTIAPITFRRPVIKPAATNKHLIANWQESARAEIDRAEQRLWSNNPHARKALAYLRTERRYTDETIRAARLGFDHKRNAVVIPWIVNGVIWAVKYRLLTPREGERKYTSLTDGNQAESLFGADLVQAGKPLAFVEGELDALLGNQIAGDLVTFVTIGPATNKLDERWHDLIRSASVVLLCLDNDKPGQSAVESNAVGLPDAYQVIRYPAEKDLTDFVKAGGDLRSWITAELAAPVRVTVRDGIRSTMLNCDLDAALLVYELVHAGISAGELRADMPFDHTMLMEVNKRLDFGASDSTIRHGLKGGVECVLSKVERESLNTEEKEYILYSTFDRTAESWARSTHYYKLLDVGEVVKNLDALLPYELLQKIAPLDDDRATLIEPLTILHEGIELSAEQQTALTDVLKTACKVKNEVEARRLAKLYVKNLSILRERIRDPHSSPLPRKLVNIAQYRRYYVRAIHEADPTPRSYEDWQLIAGVRHGAVKALIENAGLENRDRPPEIIPIQMKGNVVSQILKAAQGKGKVYELIALENGREVETEPFDLSTAQSWCAAQSGKGRTLAAKMRVCSKQVIVGDVQPVKERQPRQAAPVVDEPSDEAPAPKAPRPRREPLTLMQKFRQYQRDYLATAYCRLNGADRSNLNDLTISDLVDLLLVKPVAADVLNDGNNTGAALISVYESTTNPDDRDDFYLSLSSHDRWALIEAKAVNS
jgi:hypothetical protein